MGLLARNAVTPGQSFSCSKARSPSPGQPRDAERSIGRGVVSPSRYRRLPAGRERLAVTTIHLNDQRNFGCRFGRARRPSPRFGLCSVKGAHILGECKSRTDLPSPERYRRSALVAALRSLYVSGLNSGTATCSSPSPLAAFARRVRLVGI